VFISAIVRRQLIRKRCGLCPATLSVRGAFLLTIYQLQAPPFVTGDTYEEWKKETRLDICTGSRTEDDGAKENAGA
jgi:hypothetical protein